MPSRDVLLQVQSNQADIGFIVGEVSEPDLICKNVFSDQVVLVAARDYAIRGSLSLDGLKQHPLVLLDENYSSYRLMANQLQSMLTSKNKIQKLLSASGITPEDTLVVYDDNKMNAARFFWTMLMYGNQNVLVVDGGLSAIRDAGIAMTADVPAVTPTDYVAADKDTRWLATAEDVLAQVNEPDKNTVLLDVRTDAEYQADGKIPSSLMWDFANLFYKDGTFKDVQTTRITFVDMGIRPEKNLILYCQTSMRAAPVFLRLYDAGYRNLKIYDGAYLEWSQNPNYPKDIPTGTVAPSQKDAS